MVARRAALAVLLAFMAGSAWADLGSAFRAYDAKQLDKAYAEFRSLAELGSPLAQLNTGMMLMSGEGVKPDAVQGLGWVLSAQDNGSGVAGNMLKEVESKFNAQQKSAAQELVARWGKAAIRERLFPAAPDATIARRLQAARAVEPLRVEIPDRARVEGTFGFVETVVILGRDGRVHDVWMTAEVPENIYGVRLLDAMWRWRLEPAMLDGSAAAVASTFRMTFGIVGEDARDIPRFVKFMHERREAAKQGKASVQYQFARLLAGFDELRADEGEALHWLEESARRGYPPAQQYLGLCTLTGDSACRGSQADGLDMIARAAQSGDSSAQLLLAILNLRSGDTAGYQRAMLWLTPAARGGDYQPSKYLAALLATAPETSMRDPARARALMAPFLSNSTAVKDPNLWQVQAAALAGLGDYDAAADAQRKAIARAGLLDWNLDAMNERLRTYGSRQPWTGDLLALKGLDWVSEAWTNELTSETCEETPEGGTRVKRCKPHTRR